MHWNFEIYEFQVELRSNHSGNLYWILGIQWNSACPCEEPTDMTMKFLGKLMMIFHWVFKDWEFVITPWIFIFSTNFKIVFLANSGKRLCHSVIPFFEENCEWDKKRFFTAFDVALRLQDHWICVLLTFVAYSNDFDLTADWILKQLPDFHNILLKFKQSILKSSRIMKIICEFKRKLRDPRVL